MENLIRTYDAAIILNLSPSTLRWWRHAGKGPPFVVVGSKSVRYKVEDLKDWVNSRLVRPERESAHAKELKGEEGFLKKRGGSG